MTAVPTVLAVIGEVRKAAPNAPRAVADDTFGPSIEVTRSYRGEELIPTATSDYPLPLGRITELTFVYIRVDDERPGTLKYRFHADDELRELGQLFVLQGTDAASLLLSNDSGNEARIHYVIGGD